MDQVDVREVGNNGKEKDESAFIAVFSTAIAPIIETVIVGYQFSAGESLPVLWAVLAFVLGAHLWAGYVALRKAQLPGHYVDYKILETKYREQVSRNECFEKNYSQIRAGDSAIYMALCQLQFIMADFSSDDSLSEKENIERIVNPFVHYRREIFNLSAISKFNIAVYKYDQLTGLLRIVYRYHDDRIKTRDRSWRVGVGHVGQAFAERIPKSSQDAISSEEINIKEGTDDGNNYRSFYSLPILDAAESDELTNHPFGVLVLTSSEPEEFNPDLHDDSLIMLSKFLSVYFRLSSFQKKEVGSHDKRHSYYSIASGFGQNELSLMTEFEIDSKKTSLGKEGFDYDIGRDIERILREARGNPSVEASEKVDRWFSEKLKRGVKAASS